MIGLHMLDDYVIRPSAFQRLGETPEPFLRLSRIYAVHDGHIVNVFYWSANIATKAALAKIFVQVA